MTVDKKAKKVAIVQSNYIPWKGYFDLIASVDEFILFDDMQYTRRDWRNRNQIKTSHGLRWLTVPVRVKGKYHQTIRETLIDGSHWAETHWKTIVQNYRHASCFDEISALVAPLYSEQNHTHLSDLNRKFIETICTYLGISTRISNSWDYQLIEGKSERLADLCKQAGATEYVSGPNAKNYLNESAFTQHNISLSWFDYGGYPNHPQLWGEFVHTVTILDLLFNCGHDSHRFMKHVLSTNLTNS
jgi:hypothetical protein